MIAPSSIQGEVLVPGRPRVYPVRMSVRVIERGNERRTLLTSDSYVAGLRPLARRSGTLFEGCCKANLIPQKRYLLTCLGCITSIRCMPIEAFNPAT